jgi:peptidoglycan/LPS O-acetylase OafA/YrhL
LLIWGFVGQKTGTHWDISLPVTAKGIWSHLSMTHDVVGEDFSINHVLWSIAVECRMYLFFPLLLLLWRRIGPIATLAVGWLVSFGLFGLCVRTLGASLHFHYLGLFTMGMFAAGVAFAPEPRLQRLWGLPWGLGTLVAAFFFVAALVVGKGKGETAIALVDYAFGILSMAFLVMVSRDVTHRATRLLGWRPLVFLGTFAYSIYLIHAPLLQLLWQYPLASLQAKPLPMFIALSTVGTVVIVALAYLFFLAFERPFLRRRKSRASEQPVEETDRKVGAEG